MTPPHEKSSRAHQHRKHSSSSRHAYPSKSKRSFATPSRSEAFRLFLYVFVLAWSFVALALATHFQSLLQMSELTRFVPYAIFTSVASAVAMIGLLALVLLFVANSFTVKAECMTSGLVGVLWLVMTILASTSNAGDADVECFSDVGTNEVATSPPLDTDHFLAQYHVLVAAGCVNAFIMLMLCVVLSILTLRHHNKTKYWVSHTAKPTPEKSTSRDRDRSRSSTRPTQDHIPQLTALPKKAAAPKAKGLPLPAVAKMAGRERAAQPTPVRTPAVPARKPTTAAASKPTPPSRTMAAATATRSKPAAQTAKTPHDRKTVAIKMPPR